MWFFVLLAGICYLVAELIVDLFIMARNAVKILKEG